MSAIRWWLGLMATSVIATTTALAATPLPPDLAAAVADYDRAQVDRDRVALERLIADDYLLVNAGGRKQDKRSFVAESTAPGFTLDPFTVREETVTVWADGAMLAGVADLSGTSDGAPFKATLRFVDVWRKRDKRWQVIYTPTTRVPS